MSFEDMHAVLERDAQRLRRFRALTEVSRALTSALSMEGVLSLAVTRAADLLGASQSALFCCDEDGRWSLQAEYGCAAEGLKARTCVDAEPLDVQLEALLGNRLGDFLAVPLVVSGKVFGVLGLVRQDNGCSFEEEEWFLSAMADQVAVALEKSRLDQAALFRERLLGIVGHDLRSPLQVVKISAQVLLAKDTADPAISELAGRIEHSAAQMSNMISQLLDFTRSRLGGGIPLHPQDMDLCDAARQAITDLAVTHPRAQFRSEAEGALIGRWDRQRIDQVIYNLLGNALQHGDTSKPIRISVADRDDCAIIKVHNFGPPVPEQEQAQLFSPFRRTKDAQRGNSDGLGLGLYIANEIVHAHGGQIRVRSAAVDGTEFSVHLPLVMESRQALFQSPRCVSNRECR